jgi:hypothetical protein
MFCGDQTFKILDFSQLILIKNESSWPLLRKMARRCTPNSQVPVADAEVLSEFLGSSDARLCRTILPTAAFESTKRQ